MEKFYLKRITKNDKNIIIDYIQEFYTHNSRINGVGRLQDYMNKDVQNFELWFEKIKKEETEPFTKICYLFIRQNDSQLIGMVNIRMVKDLKDYPYGHIGYSIRPTERNKGYGKIQLYQALKELEKNNIEQCQMNCESNNIGSKKIIKLLGGIFEKNIDTEEYYLINVSNSLKDNFEKYSKYTTYNI